MCHSFTSNLQLILFQEHRDKSPKTPSKEKVEKSKEVKESNAPSVNGSVNERKCNQQQTHSE
jgi:hypothetical protein